ncbi:uncharacterized protein LOC122665833 [Telopea speciosissima]|uniref:uncharacterized protein LOC122665833 n=1 Tax=Telopea speciosissima TaxID=54955 RepID=UPI001CC3F431|nr:uncharacterized protein LOC122665833 [Telopea speciosissima]
MAFFAGVYMTKGLMGTINLFLVVLYLVDFKSHHGVEAKKVEQNEDDLELERQLKILNVPHPLKTIRTEEGDILDCVDIYKQPVFSHPLLKDHKIQVLDVYGKGHELVRGVSADINIYNPTVEPTQFTSATTWIQGGTNDQELDYIMAGWTVNPSLYGDHLTRFFTYWSVNKNKHDGCFNTPSAPLTPMSTIDGPQSVIKVRIYQDPHSGDWWLIVQNNNVFIGYWPKTLFTYLANGANSVCWGGVAKTGSNGVSPPLGNGRFPYDPFPCFIQKMEIVNKCLSYRSCINENRHKYSCGGKEQL